MLSIGTINLLLFSDPVYRYIIKPKITLFFGNADLLMINKLELSDVDFNVATRVTLKVFKIKKKIKNEKSNSAGE